MSERFLIELCAVSRWANYAGEHRAHVLALMLIAELTGRESAAAHLPVGVAGLQAARLPRR